MNQSRLESLLESVVNTAIGLAIAFTAQYVLFAVYGIKASTAVQAHLVFWMTIISVARQYIIRRIWNDRGAWIKKRLYTCKRFVTFVLSNAWGAK